jgi:prophage regulatory protein
MPRKNELNSNKFRCYEPAVELPKTGFVRLPTILSVFPISAASWWNGIKAGKYPGGVKLGPRTTAWRVSDIRNLIEATK